MLNNNNSFYSEQLDQEKASIESLIQQREEETEDIPGPPPPSQKPPLIRQSSQYSQSSFQPPRPTKPTTNPARYDGPDDDIVGIYDRAMGGDYGSNNFGSASSSMQSSYDHPADPNSDYNDQYYDDDVQVVDHAAAPNQRQASFGADVVDDDFSSYNVPAEGADVRAPSHYVQQYYVLIPLFTQPPSAEDNQYITATDNDSTNLAEWQQKFDWERKIQAANRNLFGNRTFRLVMILQYL